MSINPISSLVKPIAGAVSDAGGDDAVNAGGGFADILKTMVGQAVDAQSKAQELSKAAASGADVPLQDVVSALGKAELTLQTMVAVRDKAIEAYQEILRMPI